MSVRDHLRRNKELYILVATITVPAGITWLVMRSNAAPGGACEGIPPGGISNTASFSFAKQTINITTVLDREGRGHPGWPVRNLETKRIFFSQREAAMTLDIPEGRLSGHLKGLYPDIDGLHFERVNLVQQ